MFSNIFRPVNFDDRESVVDNDIPGDRAILRKFILARPFSKVTDQMEPVGALAYYFKRH